MNVFTKPLSAIALMLLSSAVLFGQGQPLVFPRVSPPASLTTTVGVTTVEVHYSSPSVQDREIWGNIVPYDQIWRAGANENTTISFSTEVMVGGKKVMPGTYGLHMIPTENDWTIILNEDHEAWGSYFYDESQDAARMTVTPQKHGHAEWLSYVVLDRGADNVTLALMWDNATVPIPIEVDLAATMEADFQDQLTGLAGFNWQALNQYANFYLQKGQNLERAKAMAERSVAMNKQFANLATLALIQEKMGDSESAARNEREALAMANEAQMNTYGYQLMGLGKQDRALDIFLQNTKEHKESWNVWDSLAECYLNMGDKKKAQKYYTKAHDLAPDQQKQRIEGILEGI